MPKIIICVHLTVGNIHIILPLISQLSFLMKNFIFLFDFLVQQNSIWWLFKANWLLHRHEIFAFLRFLQILVISLRDNVHALCMGNRPRNPSEKYRFYLIGKNHIRCFVCLSKKEMNLRLIFRLTYFHEYYYVKITILLTLTNQTNLNW